MTKETEILERLEEEYNNLKKNYKRSIIISCILILFMISYGGWIYWNIKSFAEEPDWMAEFLVSETQLALPELCKEAGVILKDAAPEIAEEGKNALLNLLPSLRVIVEKKNSSIINEFPNRFNSDLGKFIDDKIENHHDELSATIKQLAQGGQTDILSESISKDIKETLRKELHDESNSVLKQLDHINEELRKLKNSSNLTDAEALQKEFLELWVTLSCRTKGEII